MTWTQTANRYVNDVNANIQIITRTHKDGYEYYDVEQFGIVLRGSIFRSLLGAKRHAANIMKEINRG